MTPPALELAQVPRSPTRGIARLHGPIDARNVAALEAGLTRPPGAGFRTLILDLEDVRYVNSAGLSYLVNLSDRLEARGGSLELANAQPKVKILFDLMGMSGLFKIHPTLEAALGSLERRAAKARLSS
jgi:anti-sigma B factor antagonist